MLENETNNKIKNDKFINLKLDKNNMDIFYGRTSIKKAIDDNMGKFTGTLVDLGCGEMPYRNYILKNSTVQKYIGVDIENPAYQKKISPDIFWNGETIPVEDNSIDTVIATELFEQFETIDVSKLDSENRGLMPIQYTLVAKKTN